MWTFFIILGLGVACIILFLMMSNHDMNKLDVFKKENHGKCENIRVLSILNQEIFQW